MGFAVFTIAFQPPSLFVLKEKDNTEDIIKRPLIKNLPYIAIGFLWAAVTVLLPYIYRLNNIYIGSAELVSATFIGFIATQMIVLLEVKKEYSVFFPSVGFNGVGALMLVICVALVLISYYVTDFGNLFGIVPISSSGWLIAMIVPSVVTVAFEIFKLIKIGKTINISWNFSRDKKVDEPIVEAVAKEDSNLEKPKNIAELFENFDLEEFITGAVPDPIEPKESEENAENQPLPEQPVIEKQKEEYSIGESVIDNIFSTRKEDDE